MSTNDVNLSHEQQLSNDTTTCLALASVRTISDLRSCWICCGPFLLQRMGKRTRIQLTQTKKHANNTKKEGPVPLFWAPCVHALETHFVQDRTHIIYFIRETHFCPKSIMIRTFPPFSRLTLQPVLSPSFGSPSQGKNEQEAMLKRMWVTPLPGEGRRGRFPRANRGQSAYTGANGLHLCVPHTWFGGLLFYLCGILCICHVLCVLSAFVFVFVCVCMCLCVCVCKLHMSLYILHLHGSV